jgi:hypothetical protein
MYSSCREEIVEVFDALEADLDRALELSFDALTTPERLVMLARCEVLRRRLPALEHPLINQIGRQADARNWAASWRLRWPTGCASPARKPRAALARPPSWATGRPWAPHAGLLPGPVTSRVFGPPDVSAASTVQMKRRAASCSTLGARAYCPQSAPPQ